MVAALGWHFVQMSTGKPFELPEIDEVGYRLTRLWRLIAACVAMPVVVLVLIQLAYWPFTGQPPAHFVAFGVLCAMPIAAHVVMFPKATSETLAISLGLTFLVLIEPAVRGFGLIRLFELIGFAAAVFFGPRAIEAILPKGRQIKARLTSRIRTDADLFEARRDFPLRPNQIGVAHSTGPIDVQGFFPVMDPVEPDPFARLDGASAPVMPTTPLFWAKVTVDTDDQQVTEIYDRDEMGTLVHVSTITHDFRAAGTQIRVTEVEHLPDYPVGMAAVLWLTAQGADGLTLQRDAIEGRTTMAIRQCHDQSMHSMICDALPFLDRSETALS